MHLHFLWVCLSVNKCDCEVEISTKLLYVYGNKQPGRGTLLMPLQRDKLQPETNRIRLSFKMSI